jgi:UDP-N-acetylmuramoyl-L-alanyl-D-glutamate--2,6-diaminopimelate ligase
VINVDDACGVQFAARLAGGNLDVITYGTSPSPLGEGRGEGQPRLRAWNVHLSDSGVKFHVKSEWGSADVSSAVLGAFNVSNLLAVLGTLIASGIAFEAAVDAVSALQPVPGRLERIGGGELPLVVVDYAHTPDALEKALQALRPAVRPPHRLVCVFGCGGDRDPGKRPLMARAAAKLSDHVVVTSDNPRTEDPHAIIAQIMAGIPRPGTDPEPGNGVSQGPSPAEAIEDRQVAIFSAVHHARPGDVVLLAGKGHETYQEIAGVRHPFSDREVASSALAQWDGAKR